ncbi:hypothetical protein N7461_001013 [Penicillium sp. DV-2018c]|nr:hypothetical protein N7461_001013 [Penicillium sp. DV-2018c]
MSARTVIPLFLPMSKNNHPTPQAEQAQPSSTPAFYADRVIENRDKEIRDFVTRSLYPGQRS